MLAHQEVLDLEAQSQMAVEFDNLTGYSTAVAVVLRFIINNPLSGVGDIVVTNATQGGVVFADHITYKPSLVDDGFGIPFAYQEYKLKGAHAADSTTVFSKPQFRDTRD